MSAPLSPRLSVQCRVVIVDDHGAVIEMLKQVIESIPGYRVVGSAQETRGALALCCLEQPDLIVLDLVLPPTSGLALLSELKAACVRARVLVFSGHLPPASIQRALSSGAHGLVGKMAALDEFRLALQEVSSGRVFFGRAASDEIRNIVYGRPIRALQSFRLTEREKTVLRAIADGLSSKEISARLNLSIHTVVNHRTRLMRKTGLRGIAQLSRYAAQIGLVEGELGAAEPT